MDTSVFAFDLPAWLSWGSNVLYMATVGLALLVVTLVSCLVGQAMRVGGHSGAHKSGTRLVH
jgi:hypothetical protein